MRRMEPMSEQQTEKMIQAAFAQSKRDGVMLALASKHATRASELAGLKVADVNFKDGSIFITRRKGSITKWEALLPSEVRMLKSYLDGHSDPLLFPSEKGGQLSTVQVYRIFRYYAELTGVPDVSRSPHAFRHSLGQQLADKGMDVSMLQVVMGHKNINSTMRYFTHKQSVVDAEKMRLLTQPKAVGRAA
jgi:integrase/recombinase XerD